MLISTLWWIFQLELTVIKVCARKKPNPPDVNLSYFLVLMLDSLSWKGWRKQQSLHVTACDTVCPGHPIPTSPDQKQDSVVQAEMPSEMSGIPEIDLLGKWTWHSIYKRFMFFGNSNGRPSPRAWTPEVNSIFGELKGFCVSFSSSTSPGVCQGEETLMVSHCLCQGTSQCLVNCRTGMCN